MNMIEIKNVSKKFKNETVLSGVNLTLEDNMIYGFVGRNGSGKSVLFKLICGYLKTDEGDIIIKGRKLDNNYDFPDKLGALIENPGFMWHESAYKNLKFLADINKRIGAEEVKEWIRKVGLNPESKKHVGKYSLGMKQRLGIAQALMEDPEIIVLDEPMNSMDEVGVEEMRRLIASMKKDNRVILIASHIKEDIDILCDKVYYMKNGKVVDE
ncbi:ABC-2 type transport system ATP-binding protein [Eubacterium ruminantium]|nr:ABC-2 type transport system ATP-binding protein [Eubacterium ruminantium]